MLPFHPKTVLIMTALPLERDAILRFLVKRGEETTANSNVYDRCSFKDLVVFVGLSGAGNINAGPEVERALNKLQPDVAVFCGIAGGVKDVKLGDVVVSNKVYSYEAGSDGADFKPRPQVGLPSYILTQIVGRIAQDGEWKSRTNGYCGRDAKAFVGAIAAGEKVVKSTSSAVAKLIQTSYPDTLAVEMEGAAFMRATYQHRVDAIVVRGISDLLDFKAEAEEHGSQEVAADHAASFVAALLSDFSKIVAGDMPPTATGPDTVGWWVRLRELVVRLYPTGPRENDIWQVSGGDLSRLDLSENGYTQWSRALRKLEQGGGGGTITVEKLLTSIQRDFAGNTDLQYLRDLASRSAK